MYPGDPGPPGSDCAGTILAVGAGVTRFKPGESVFGLAHGCLGTVVTGPADMLVHMPTNVDFVQAATMPTVFVTVEVALGHVADVKPGDGVLVHAGAGGVGLAAVQYIHAAGAVAYATAGSSWKRALLRSLGVEHVASSRDTGFVDSLALPKGNVDVVLNSLTSPGMVTASLAVLQQSGMYASDLN